MNSEEFDHKLTEKIKEEKIAPKPRWHFLLKDYVVWVIGILALLIGALAVSVMIYFLQNNGWELREQTHKSALEFFLLTLPYFWIIFLGFFVFILYYNVKHSDKGYRYPVWLISFFAILASVILGGIFHVFGVGQKIDNILGEKAPLYDTVMNRQLSFWFNPTEGRMAGIIADEVVGPDFYLVDPSGKVWHILGRDFALDSRPANFLKAGEPVNLIGEITALNVFRADFIRPLVPGRQFFERPNIKAHRGPCRDNVCQPPLPRPTPLEIIPEVIAPVNIIQ